MDALAVKLADQLETEGYKSIAKLKVGRLSHKTVALRAGLGFIGKNNLLVTNQYGCAVMLGKVLTTAPFITMSEKVKEPQCGDCNICVDVCPSKALLGKTWSVPQSIYGIPLNKKRLTILLIIKTDLLRLYLCRNVYLRLTVIYNFYNGYSYIEVFIFSTSVGKGSLDSAYITRASGCWV